MYTLPSAATATPDAPSSNLPPQVFCQVSVPLELNFSRIAWSLRVELSVVPATYTLAPSGVTATELTKAWADSCSCACQSRVPSDVNLIKSDPVNPLVKA